MPSLASASDQARASAIWPTAAAAWLSSSFSAPRCRGRARGGRARWRRRRRRAPRRPSAASAAISSASEREPVALQLPGRAIDQQRRADLDDDAAIGCERLRAHRRRHAASARRRSRRRSPARSPIASMQRVAAPPRSPSPVDGREQERRAGRRRACSAAAFFLQRRRRRAMSTWRQRDDLRLLGQPVAIGLELAADGLVGLRRDLPPAPSTRCSSTRAALDMAEEAVADAGAFMRAFDQAGNVGEHELAAVDARRRRGSGCSVVKG